MAYNIVSSVIAKFTNLVGSFVRTVSLSLTEVGTTSGHRFNHEFDIVFSSGEIKYFLYNVPVDADRTVGFQNRIFKSNNGSADLELYWDSTGFTTGTLEVPFNEYNKYTNGNQLEISEISEPTVIGTLRETDFLTGTGQGSNSSGDVSSELGYRLYAPGTFGIVKITNTHTSSNRIILGYNWVEIPEDQLEL